MQNNSSEDHNGSEIESTSSKSLSQEDHEETSSKEEVSTKNGVETSSSGEISNESNRYSTQRSNEHDASSNSRYAVSSNERSSESDIQPPVAMNPGSVQRKSSSSTVQTVDLSVRPSTSALDLVKAWSVNKMVCTRQLLAEKLGRATKTIDAEVELQIEITRDVQRKLEELLQQARQLTDSFSFVVQNQQVLSKTFREMAQKMPELNQQLEFNADTQKLIHKKGETLLGDLNFFHVQCCNSLWKDD